MEEHVQAARTNLLGSMPLEFRTNLELARVAARRLSAAALRDRVTAAATDLLRVSEAWAVT